MKAGSLPRLSPLAESSPQLLRYITESPIFFMHLSIQNTRIQTQKDKCHVFSRVWVIHLCMHLSIDIDFYSKMIEGRLSDKREGLSSGKKKVWG